ncbi:hypothetical protein T439DRAFT_341984 [Meredithblackwellia eburnea MCA 4105]
MTSSSSSKKHKSHHSSHSHRDDNKDRDRDSKRHKSSHRDRDHHRSSSSRKPHRSKDKDQESEEDEWVEKPQPQTTNFSATSAPPVDSYGTFNVREPRATSDGIRLSAAGSMTDGFGDGEDGSSSVGGRGGGAFAGLREDEGDLFSSMGVERKKKEVNQKPDPSQMMGQSSRELNKAHWQGVPNESSATSSASAQATGSPAPGSTGSTWRMMKLKRAYEAAEEEGRPIEEVAVERFGSVELFREAVEERRVLDERGGRGRRETGSSGNGLATPTADSSTRRFIFTESGGTSAAGSRPPSRGSFRKPGEQALERSNSSSSDRGGTGAAQQNSRPSTPVPNVFTPQAPSSRTPIPRVGSALSQSIVLNPDPTTTESNSKPPLTQSELNKLQAKVLKARLMGNDNADELEEEYEKERERALNAENGVGAIGSAGGDQVQVMPTLDGRGRLYDIGTGAKEEEVQPGKRKKKEKYFETHDPKTGELIRHNADDDSTSLEELVRQERFAAGAQDQKNLDFEMASRIAGDAKFMNDLDYVDENAERLARKKMKTDVMKKAFAVQDYAKTKKALDNCTLCFGDEGQPPRSAVVALGTRAYLGLLDTEGIVKGHCRIVPIQHHFSTLEAEEETWDEIKNFMKTLMQMFAEEDKGVIFFESYINPKHQRHCCIEAIPIAFDLFDQIPGYFAEAIDNSEQEWSQHKKRIVFSAARPFRRSLVPNLPYFAVQWDYKGEKGYGHVIEGVDDGPDHDADGYEIQGEAGEKGAGEFPRWFATEIVGSMLDLEPRRWRKPKRLDYRQNDERVRDFRKKYDSVDWTKQLRSEQK